MSSGLSIALAAADDASSVAALRNAVASALTKRHGLGHWSSMSSDKGIRSSMKRSSIYVAREGTLVVATFELATKKPWAIDRRYFTDVKRPLSPPEVPPISVPGHVVHLQPGLVTTIADAPDTAPPPQSG